MFGVFGSLLIALDSVIYGRYRAAINFSEKGKSVFEARVVCDNDWTAEMVEKECEKICSGWIRTRVLDRPVLSLTRPRRPNEDEDTLRVELIRKVNAVVS